MQGTAEWKLAPPSSQNCGSFRFAPPKREPRRILPCRLSCGECRTPIADEGRRMFLAFGPPFDFGFPPVVPPAFRPTCHIFDGSHLVDVGDGLPRYLGHKGGRLA